MIDYLKTFLRKYINIFKNSNYEEFFNFLSFSENLILFRFCNHEARSPLHQFYYSLRFSLILGSNKFIQGYKHIRGALRFILPCRHFSSDSINVSYRLLNNCVIFRYMYLMFMKKQDIKNHSLQ
jgi:hypothetical protein